MANGMIFVLVAYIVCYLDIFSSAMSEVPEDVIEKEEYRSDRRRRCVESVGEINANDLDSIPTSKNGLKYRELHKFALHEKKLPTAGNFNHDNTLGNRRNRRHGRRPAVRKPTTERSEDPSTTWKTVTVFPEYKARYPGSKRRYYSRNYPRIPINPEYAHHNYRANK